MDQLKKKEKYSIMCVGVVTLSNLFGREPNWLWYKVSIRFRLIGNHSIRTSDNLRANKDPGLVEGICLIQIIIANY